MQKNEVLKKLLAVSAVAAMFGPFGVHAQSNSSSSSSSTGDQSTQGTSATSSGASGSQGMQGSSQGMESSSQGKDQTGSSSGTSGMSGSTGTSAAGQSSGGTAGQGSTGASSGATGQGSAATGGAAAGATAGAAAAGSLSKTDQKILMDMARANIAEIEAGKLAQSNSQNDQVKSFAQQMIDDHTKALGDVQQVAQSKGVTLPTEPDAKHKAMAAKLQKMSGDTFDKTYMSQAGLADHKKVLSMLRQDQKRAKDPDVKALAEKMTPVVEQHLKSAQQTPAVKSGTTSGK